MSRTGKRSYLGGARTHEMPSSCPCGRARCFACSGSVGIRRRAIASRQIVDDVSEGLRELGDESDALILTDYRDEDVDDETWCEHRVQFDPTPDPLRVVLLELAHFGDLR